uniref:Uncharacterized protein n=1 Tax=Arion vulgaris TaxID=1028688 RepID=A0A0B7BDL1_9EUPU
MKQEKLNSFEYFVSSITKRGGKTCWRQRVFQAGFDEREIPQTTCYFLTLTSNGDMMKKVERRSNIIIIIKLRILYMTLLFLQRI